MTQTTNRSCPRLISVLIFILSCALTPASATETGLPDQFTVKYVLTKGPLNLGEMTRKLYINEAGNYVYESFSEPVGYARWFTKSVLTERSEWNYHNDHLQPLVYTYDRSGDKKERHVRLSFDWEKQRVTNTINNDPWKMDVPDNALDKLLYQLALMRDLALNKKELSYQIADGGSMKTYSFKILGEETLNTKLGRITTVKVLKPGERDTTIWCATEFNYVPVRIEQSENGIHLVMNIIELSGIPQQTGRTN